MTSTHFCITKIPALACALALLACGPQPNIKNAQEREVLLKQADVMIDQCVDYVETGRFDEATLKTAGLATTSARIDPFDIARGIKKTNYTNNPAERNLVVTFGQTNPPSCELVMTLVDFERQSIDNQIYKELQLEFKNRGYARDRKALADSAVENLRGADIWVNGNRRVSISGTTSKGFSVVKVYRQK